MAQRHSEICQSDFLNLGGKKADTRIASSKILIDYQLIFWKIIQTVLSRTKGMSSASRMSNVNAHTNCTQFYNLKEKIIYTLQSGSVFHRDFLYCLSIYPEYHKASQQY